MEYTIHPVLVIEIETDRPGYAAYFQNEYERVDHGNPHHASLRVTVHIVPELPPAQGQDRQRRRSFKRIFSYEYLIRGLETPHVHIYFKDIAWGRLYPKALTLFVQSQVLEPIVYYKLLGLNIFFMHGAGLSDGESGYLFAAAGGAGKTTLTLALMNEGLQVLGDDLLLVDANNSTVLPYLRPLHLFTYNVNALRGTVLPMQTRLRIGFKDILRNFLERLTREQFLIATRVHADRIYPGFSAARRVRLRKISFLRSSGPPERTWVVPANVEALARMMVEVGDLRQSLFENVLANPEMNQVIQDELQVARTILSSVRYVDFINTRMLDLRDLSSLRRMLQEE